MKLQIIVCLARKWKECFLFVFNLRILNGKCEKSAN